MQFTCCKKHKAKTSFPSDEELLADFDTKEEVADEPINDWDIKDTGLQLNGKITELIRPLFENFSKKFNRTGINCETWFSDFQNFIGK